MNKTGISWTDLTWNPVSGCTKVSEGCKYCLLPETLILYADWKWRPIGDAKIGDWIIGFDEYVASGKGMRCLRRTQITGVTHTTTQAYEIKTTHSTVMASGDHKWLHGLGSSRWITTRNLTMLSSLRWVGFDSRGIDTEFSSDYRKGYLTGITDGDGTWRYEPGKPYDRTHTPYWRLAMKDSEAIERTKLFLQLEGVRAYEGKMTQNNGHEHIVELSKLETRSLGEIEKLDKILNPIDSEDYKRGYVAGFFDAEGSFNHANIRLSNTNIDYIQNVYSYLTYLGFSVKIEKRDPSDNHHRPMYNVRIAGPRRERLRFFSVLQPAISRKSLPLIDHSLDVETDNVIGLRNVGMKNLIDITTESHTFIANGLMTHNCYAEAWSHRWNRSFEVTLHPEKLDEVRKISSGSKVFVNSMSDLFHPKIPPDFIVKVFRTIESRPDVTFQILTKRPELIWRYTTAIDDGGDFEELLAPANAWFGVSVENIYHKNRIELLKNLKYGWPLLQLSKLFISFEPLLGDVGKLDLKGIDWAIIGGESGPHHRPMNIEWARSIVEQAREQGIAVWMKQLGGIRPGGNLENFPEDLRIREFPYEMKSVEMVK